MPGLDDSQLNSSPLSVPTLSSSASNDEALQFYKAQYEQLESELADFQASSRELEAELERDVEEAEKRERMVREKVEALGYEVEEWKSKCKQSKVEANNAQNALQKEITTLRETNRTLQLKLRDTEVANDDYERQARNTTSSLEDMESKYSVGIERNIILEGEVKSGEQEREALRIETQRLRDELSDLKVEAEIRQDKLRHAEAANERSRLRKPTPVGASIPRPKSSISEHSPSTTTASSPTIATPPTKSVSSTASDTPTPPSPPTSDRSILLAKTPAQSNTKLRSSLTNSVTPRPAHFSARPTPRHSRGPSVPVPNGLATPASRRTTQTRTDGSALPNSASLTQIRGLIGKMQKLEQRVQSVRSKLPAPTHTPPRASPRPGSALSTSYISGNITVRSSRKRTSGNASTTSSVAASNHIEPLDLNTRTATRQSFGLPPPTPTRDLNTGVSGSRPGSRASLHSRPSISNLPSAANASRPSSRQSMSGARTPLGHYPSNSERIPRPRSSIGGNFSSAHGHSSSVHRLSGYGLEHSPDTSEVTTPTPARRTTLSKEGMSSIPMPSPARRQSATGTGNTNRRVSSGTVGDMAPPERKKKLSGVGETY